MIYRVETEVDIEADDVIAAEDRMISIIEEHPECIMFKINEAYEIDAS